MGLSLLAIDGADLLYIMLCSCSQHKNSALLAIEHAVLRCCMIMLIYIARKLRPIEAL